jgi:hypothetical protein
VRKIAPAALQQYGADRADENDDESCRLDQGTKLATLKQLPDKYAAERKHDAN